MKDLLFVIIFMRLGQQIRVAALLCLLATTAFGQWKQLATFNSQITSIHFQSEQGRPELGKRSVGFVGTANGEVWRSTDLGTSWTRSATLTAQMTPSPISGRITSFAFKDSLIGWLSALEQSTKPCVYRTTDGGINWLAIDSLRGSGTSVTYNPAYGNLILTTWSGYNMVTSNDGARWITTGITTPMCGVAFCTGRQGVMTGTIQEPIATSSDGGRTWTSAQTSQEMWHPHGLKNTSIFFAVAEITSQVAFSGDYGDNWADIKDLSGIDLTGYIGGTAKALFLQAKDGVYVSRNMGQAWDFYCGPGNDYDTRMFVTGDTVFAGSVDGKLFVNFYGVSHYRDFLEFSQPAFDFVSAGCSRLDSVIRLKNISTCEKVTFDAVEIWPPGSKFGVFTQSLPKILGSEDSIRIFYSPDDLQVDTAELSIKYTVGDSQYTRKIRLKGNGTQGLNVNYFKELELLLASDCAKLDTFITIKNGPCDSVTLISAAVSDPGTFSITTPQLPYTVGPDGTIRLTIGVNTVTPGSYVATILVRLSNGQTTVDTTLTLRLKVLTSKDPLVALSKSAIKFDSVSTCEVKYDTLRITNTICKQIVLEYVQITPNDPALTVVYLPPVGKFLKPNESEQVILAYAPSQETPLTASITIRTGFDPANVRDSIINVSGFGKAFSDAALLYSSLTFPPMLECEANTVEGYLVNFSCDSAEIIGFDQAGAGYQIIEPSLPAGMASGDTLRIRILVGPIASGSKFDSIGIRIRTNSGAEQLLKLTLLGTVKPKIRKLAMPGLLALANLQPCIPFDTTITVINFGICDTLDIDSVLLAGAPWLTLSGTQLPMRLAPKDSLKVQVHVEPPMNAQSTGSIRFVGPGVDTSIVVQVGTGAYVDPLPLSLSDSVFNAFLCKNARQYIVLSNPHCDTLVIDTLSLTGSNGQFRFTSGFTLPLRIPPNQDTTLEIEFDPAAPGDSTALLSIGSGENNITKRIPLLGSYRNTKGFAGIEAVAEDGTKQILIGEGEFFTIKIRTNNFIEKARDLNFVECTLRFNDNVLTVQNQSYLWGTLDGGYVRGSGIVKFRMKKSLLEDIQANQELASITFMTTIGDSSWSPIDLTVRLNPEDSLYEQCVLEPLAITPIILTIDDTCGDDIIRKWINRRLDIFDNFSIVPNPSAGAEEVVVSFDLLHDQDVTLSLFDANGKKLRDHFYAGLTKGQHTIRMATAPLSEGWCFIMVESPGQRDMKKLILQK